MESLVEKMIFMLAAAQPYPQKQLIHQLFEALAVQHPDATAVVYEDGSLTYEQLNQRANVVAHRLIAFGVQPDDLIAICVKRSLDMVVGFLAVLKASAGYVPLDPAYSADRLVYMLADSAPVALLTQSDLLTGFEVLTVPHLLLDTLTIVAEYDNTANPDLLG